MTESKNESKKLRELIKDVRIAMLTTLDEEGELRSRPMATITVESDETLLFFLREESGKANEVQGHPNVNVAYSDPAGNRYVSVKGHARIFKDAELAKKHWSPMLEVWFQGPDDPSLAVLEVRVKSAEYWDGPSGLVARVIALGKAVLGEQDPDLGEHGFVERG